MLSIVWADMIQFFLMAISGVVIGAIAMNAVAIDPLLVPDGWSTPFFGARLELDWSTIIPEINEKIASDGYSFFPIFFMMITQAGAIGHQKSCFLAISRKLYTTSVVKAKKLPEIRGKSKN